jgi:hypothetical protein
MSPVRRCGEVPLLLVEGAPGSSLALCPRCRALPVRSPERPERELPLPRATRVRAASPPDTLPTRSAAAGYREPPPPRSVATELVLARGPSKRFALVAVFLLFWGGGLSFIALVGSQQVVLVSDTGGLVLFEHIGDTREAAWLADAANAALEATRAGG